MQDWLQRLLRHPSAHVRLRRLAGAALVTLTAAGALPLQAEDIKINVNHIADGKPLRAQWFTPSAERASGAAAILLHGCGGLGARGKLNARHAAARDWLLDRGIAVLFPESFTSRGLEEICTVKMQSRSIRQSDRVDDVMAAHAWLRQQPGIDGRKIVLWGWSHGGSAVLNTVTRKPALGDFSDDVKFVEAIAFYPGCTGFARDSAPAKISSPLTILIGEADDWTPAPPCSVFAQRLRNNEQPVSITLYPGAYHDFDNPAGKLRVRSEVPNGVNPAKGVTVGPDPKAREDAMAKIDALLRKHSLVRIAKAQP